MSRKLDSSMIYPNAKPQRVYELFCLGLIDTIYLSQDFKELAHFNSTIKQTVLQFVRKTKTDKQIYLKFQSSYADFCDQGKIILLYHWIRIGPVGSQQAITQLRPSPAMTTESLKKLRVLSLGNIAYELFRIKSNAELKINYTSNQVMIYSHFNKGIHPRELEIIKEWQKIFEEGTFNVNPKTTSDYLTDPEKEAQAQGSNKKVEDASTSSTKLSADKNKSTAT